MKMKILPELLKSVEFGGGGPKVFGFVMKIGSKLTDEEYDLWITPAIIRLFASPDRQMRVCLLDHLGSMIDHFPPKLVTDKIFPQMVSRLIRSLSICSSILIHLGHWLHRRCPGSPRANRQGRIDYHHKAFGSYHQR